MGNYKLDALHTFIKVLVIDDVYISKKSITRQLKESGCFVLTASRGDEAINKIQKYKPDIVALSHSLEDITISSLLKRVRTYSQSVKIIFLKSAENKGAESFEKSDYIDFSLSLPIKTEDLKEIISMI